MTGGCAFWSFWAPTRFWYRWFRDVKAGLLDDHGRLRRTNHHLSKAFLTGPALTNVLEPVGRVHSPVLRRGTCNSRTRVLGHSGKLPQGKNLFYAQHAFLHEICLLLPVLTLHTQLWPRAPVATCCWDPRPWQPAGVEVVWSQVKCEPVCGPACRKALRHPGAVYPLKLGESTPSARDVANLLLDTIKPGDKVLVTLWEGLSRPSPAKAISCIVCPFSVQVLASKFSAEVMGSNPG